MSNKNIIIVTQSFPYSIAAEDTFILPELKYLVKVYDKITFMPQIVEGELFELNYKNVYIDYSLSNYLKNNKIKKMLYILIFFFENIFKFIKIFSFEELLINKQFFMYVLNSIYFSRYFYYNTNLIRNKLIYLYWMDYAAVGLAFVKKMYPEVSFISRCHGIDIYPERMGLKRFPFRNAIFQNINAVFFASDAAFNYTLKFYPLFKEKFYLAGLGIDIHENLNCIDEKKDQITIVSCSYLIPVKRVELIAQSIAIFARKNLNLNIKWVHFGDGPLKSNILYHANKNFPKNIDFQLKGNCKNNIILEYYKNNPIDFFITTSESEGGRPVSISEALSFGIPIIATNVGGIPEMVNSNTGALIPSISSPQDIAKIIELFIKENKHIILRKSSRLFWEQNLNSEINSSNFIQMLQNI